MFLVMSCPCPCAIYWCQWEHEDCSWSSADRRCFNYISVINHFIACLSGSCIRDMTVCDINYNINTNHIGRSLQQLISLCFICFSALALQNEYRYILHYNDVIMSGMASQIASVSYFPKRLFRHRSKKTPKLHGIGLCEGNSPPLTGELTGKMFPFDDVIMEQKIHHIRISTNSQQP